MATIAFQVTQGGFGNLNKTYTLADADMTRIITAYQAPANGSVNGTATRVQVLQYWLGLIIGEAVATVQAYENAVALAAVPPAAPMATS